jgi:hypothetical protein
MQTERSASWLDVTRRHTRSRTGRLRNSSDEAAQHFTLTNWSSLSRVNPQSATPRVGTPSPAEAELHQHVLRATRARGRDFRIQRRPRRKCQPPWPLRSPLTDIARPATGTARDRSEKG